MTTETSVTVNNGSPNRVTFSFDDGGASVEVCPNGMASASYIAIADLRDLCERFLVILDATKAKGAT